MTTYCTNPVCCCLRPVAKVIDAYPGNAPGAMVVRAQLRCRHVKTFISSTRQFAEVGE